MLGDGFSRGKKLADVGKLIEQVHVGEFAVGQIQVEVAVQSPRNVV